jgi:signal transduction histidine kinase/ActR/RegA family two-component response regulator
MKNFFEKIWAGNYVYVFLALWTFLVIVSVIWNFYRNSEEIKERALIEANTIFEHNIAYRRWNTISGGVYVKVSEKNQPNPYLVVPDRDLRTVDGQLLTLINPFRMTKQTYELLREQSPLSAINRTVSLRPLNPDNAPDEWEKNALMLIESKKINMAYEITKINGEPYMRLLRTYSVEKGCLKCHEFQGYKEGDIRGGISIAIPMKPYYEAATVTQKVIITSHLVLWVLGLGIILLFSRGLRRYQTNQKKLEEHLLQAQKMESLGRFACGVAHDFNNLLSAINGFTFLLQRKLENGETNGEVLDYVNNITMASKLGKNLTSNLLAFGRKQIIDKKPLKINSVVKNIAEIVKPLISEDININVYLSEEEFFIYADQHQIEQIVINLCTNAKDAMPEGGNITIQTKYVVLDKEYVGTISNIPIGEYMVISVSDTGSGIDETNLRKIFEPFFSTKEPGRGTGLGLSIVYGIVSEHNGYIDISTKKSEGTIFKVYFPVFKTEESFHSIEKQLTLSEQSYYDYVEGLGKTILVADDDFTTRKFLDLFLRQRGFNVIIAEDGISAINKFIDNKDFIDMVIIDVLLPKKNGKEVFYYIKEIKPQIKILFISGYTSDILNAKGILDEDLDFLPKPIDVHLLINKLQETFQNVNTLS